MRLEELPEWLRAQGGDIHNYNARFYFIGEQVLRPNALVVVANTVASLDGCDFPEQLLGLLDPKQAR